MPLVPVTFAEWLKSVSLISTVEYGVISSAWADLAVESEAVSPFALQADAAIEAGRELSFLGQPLARDQLRVAGHRVSWIGTARTLSADRGGYRSSPLVFVIGAVEEKNNTTILTVLRRMLPEA